MQDVDFLLQPLLSYFKLSIAVKVPSTPDSATWHEAAAKTLEAVDHCIEAEARIEVPPFLNLGS